jgi:hypothetical protein
MPNKTIKFTSRAGKEYPGAAEPGIPQEDSQSMLLAGTGWELREPGRDVGRVHRGPGNNILYLTGNQEDTHPLCNSLEDKVIVFTEDRSTGRSTACVFCRGRCVTGVGGGGGSTCPYILSNLPRAREKNTRGLLNRGSLRRTPSQ